VGNSIRQVATMSTHIRCRSATLLRVEIHLRTIFRHKIAYGNSVLGSCMVICQKLSSP